MTAVAVHGSLTVLPGALLVELRLAPGSYSRACSVLLYWNAVGRFEEYTPR